MRGSGLFGCWGKGGGLFSARGRYAFRWGFARLFVQSSSQETVALLEQLDRFSVPHAPRGHDGGDLDAASGLFQIGLRVLSPNSGEVSYDSRRPAAEFLASGSEVDHQVSVGFADSDHGGSGDHIEDHFGGGGGFHSGGAGDHLGSDDDGDPYIHGGIILLWRVRAEENGFAPAFPGRPEGGSDKSRLAAGGDAENHILVRHLARGDLCGAIAVLRAFNSPEDSLLSPGDNSLNRAGFGAEGGRTLGSVEDAQSPTCTGPDIEQSPTSADRVCHEVNCPGNMGDLLSNTSCDPGVLTVDKTQDAFSGERVDFRR